MNTSQETTLDLLTRFNRAFENHRPGDLDALIGEDCVLENTAPAPDGARYAGREDCLHFWKDIATNPALQFTAEEIWAVEGRGLIRWELRWGPADADHVRGVNIMRVERGQIVEAMGYVKG